MQTVYRVFSRDVTAAMLVSQNKGMAAMLVSPTNPLGIELYYHANVFFCFGGKTRLLITRVKTLYTWIDDLKRYVWRFEATWITKICLK